MKLLKSTISLALTTFIASNGYAIERVSVNTSGGNPDGNSLETAVSADGRFSAFQSTANNIVAGDTNFTRDIFVYDRQAQTTERVSETSAGGQTTNGRESILPDISDDGNLVVFASRAENLTSDTDTNGNVLDIFLHNRSTGQTILISKAGGTTASTSTANGESTRPTISSDGTYIAYQSKATNILAADTDASSDIYVYHIASGTTKLASVNSSGVKGNARSEEASISQGGRFVAFTSRANNLGGSVNDAVFDVFFRDMLTNVTTAVTYGANDQTGFTDSQQAHISDDGTIIVFESYRRDLSANDTNGDQDVFVYDVTTGTNTQMSVSTTGEPGNARSGHPGISADGRYIVFESSSSNLDVGVTNGQLDVYVRDRALGVTKRISLDESGNEGTEFSQKPRISSTGRYVIFSSESPFVSGDTQSPVIEDAYLVDIGIDDGGAPVVPGNPSPFDEVSRVYSDLDGDKKSDILWRHASSGNNWHYLMNGNTIKSDALLNNVADLGWQMAAVGDFNADGKSDIFWHNDRTGDNFVYLMNGGTITSLTFVNKVADLGWKVKGSGDFDGDGKSDILWRHEASGVNWIYLMDGVSIKSQGQLNAASTDWKVAGVGDFNGDRRSDILWRNANSGLNWIYLLEGIAIKSQGAINSVPDLNWKVEGIGDLNGDSRSDIVWRNSVTGENYTYQMEGLHIGGNFHINTVPDTNWEIQSIGDFNGDAKSGDILWSHARTGENYVYHMNAFRIQDLLFINRVGDLNWQIQGNSD